MDEKFRFDAQLESCLVHVHHARLPSPPAEPRTVVDNWADDITLPARTRARLGSDCPEHAVSLQAGRLSLMLGRNGAGKSILLDALRFRNDRESIPVSASLVVSLPDDAANDQWEHWWKETAEQNPLAFRDEHGEHYDKDVLRETYRRPLLTLIEDSLAGPKPGDLLRGLGQLADDVVQDFGCTPDEIQGWRARCWSQEVEAFGSGRDEPGNYGLRTMVPDFLLAGVQELPHNPEGSDSEPSWIAEGQVLSSEHWMNEPQIRDLIVPGIREFLMTSNRAVVDDSGLRLLAPFPESGPIRDILDRQFNELSAYPSDPNVRLPFPVGLFEPFSVGGQPHVASFRIPFALLDAFAIIDLSPDSVENSVDTACRQLAERCLTVTATASDTKLEFRLDGIEMLRSGLALLSQDVAHCDIGIDEIDIAWPPDGAMPTRVLPTGRQEYRFAGVVPDLLPRFAWKDASSGAWLDIEDASLGQQEVIALFAQLARLRMTPAAQSTHHAILISDEFDRSLHPSASTAVLERLAEIIEPLPGVSAIVATHNVAALGRKGLRAVERILVSRRHDNVHYESSFNSSIEVVASILGSSFLEALQLKRLHLLVEGNHDEMVIRRLLHDQLPAIEDVDIVNGRGIRAWSAIIANSLRFLDSPILLVHDKRNLELEEEWRALQNAFDLSGRLPDWADTGLSAMLADVQQRKKTRKGDTELRTLLFLLKDVVFDGNQAQISRLHLFGLDCDDIVDLLPITAFPKANPYNDWADAHEQFKKRYPNAAGQRFKRELGINEQSVESAIASSLDTVHPELARLSETVRSLLDVGGL